MAELVGRSFEEFAGALEEAHDRDRERRETRDVAATDTAVVNADTAFKEALLAAGNALRAAMDAAGWTAQWLGSVLGIDASVVESWREGERLQPPWLELAMAALAAGDRLDVAGWRERMVQGGWDTYGLADLLGVDQREVSEWIAEGKTPPGVALAISEGERRIPVSDLRRSDKSTTIRSTYRTVRSVLRRGWPGTGPS